MALAMNYETMHAARAEQPFKLTCSASTYNERDLNAIRGIGEARDAGSSNRDAILIVPKRHRVARSERYDNVGVRRAASYLEDCKHRSRANTK